MKRRCQLDASEHISLAPWRGAAIRRTSRVWLRRAVTSYGECSCLHRFSCTTARRSDAHGFPRALHDVFGRCTARYGLKNPAQIAIKVNTKTRHIGFCFARPLSVLHVSAWARKRYRKSAGAHLSHCHRKSTPPYARAAERAQALDVHCVLDPSNPSNPSDGAPLDQLCPSMRGCLSIRAAVNAHSAATHNKTSNAGTRSAARHQVAGQAQPPAAR